MSSIKNLFRRLRIRPGLFIFVAAVTFLFTFAEQYNPWTAKYAYLKNILSVDFLDTLCNMSNRAVAVLKTPRVALFTAAVGLFLLFAICVFAGLLSSGFFNQLSLATFDKPKHRGEYRVAMGRYTFKLAFFFFIGILLSAIVVIAVLYSSIPSIMSFKLFFTGTAGMLLPTILLIVVTLVTVFFAAVFFTMYLTYILPSIIFFRKGGTGVAFRMVNGYCWYLLPRTLLYMLLDLGIRVALWAIHYGLASVPGARFIMVATWLLRTLINLVYIYFVFNTFAAMKSDMFDAA